MSTPPPSGHQQPEGPYPQGPYPQGPHPQPPYAQSPYAQGPYAPGPGPHTPYGAPYQPWGQGYSPFNHPAPVNGVAIGSLVLGFLCFLPAVGLILGIVALVQIKKKGERGTALAVTGSVMSSLGLALWVLSLSTGVASRVWDGIEEGASSGASLARGECFDSPGGLKGAAGHLDQVPCSGEHDGEVFAVVTLPEGPFPGDGKVTGMADSKCYALRTDYAMDTWAVPHDVDVYYLVPSRQSWRLGEREITCVFGNTDESKSLFGSLRNDESTLGPHQLAYLKAVNLQNTALDSQPWDTPDEDMAANRRWAGRVSDALTKEVRRLRAHAWPAGAEKPVATVAKEAEELQKAWARAAKATDSNTFYKYYDQAMVLAVPDRSVTARKALGLATTPPSPQDGGESGDSGGGDSGIEV